MSTPAVRPLEVVLVNSVPGVVGSKELVIDKEAQSDFHKALLQAHVDVDRGTVDRITLVTDAALYGWVLVTSRPIEFRVGEGVDVSAATLSQARGRFRNAEPSEVERMVSTWKARIKVDPIEELAVLSTAGARP